MHYTIRAENALRDICVQTIISNLQAEEAENNVKIWGDSYYRLLNKAHKSFSATNRP